MWESGASDAEIFYVVADNFRRRDRTAADWADVRYPAIFKHLQQRRALEKDNLRLLTRRIFCFTIESTFLASS